MEEMVEEAARRAWTKTCTGLRTSPLCFLAPSCQRSAGGTKGLTHGDILPTHSRRHLSWPTTIILPSFIVGDILSLTIKLGRIEDDMDRDEILARNRMDNRHLDERDHKLADEASAWGVIALTVTVAVIFLIRSLTKGGDPYDLLAILFAYLSAGSAYRWSKTRSRWAFLTSALYTALVVTWLCAYALLG